MSGSTIAPTETSPLIATTQPEVIRRGWFPSLHRVLFTSFLLALTFAFTQTSLMYAFRTMTCEDYYLRHPDALPPVPDRCAVRRIEADTAGSIALMASTTTFCTIFNLFITGWWIKRYGPKSAMFQQTFWAALRNLTQIYSIHHGGATGIKIIQITQLFNILGSGGGYQLAANGYVAILVEPEKRTGMFGVLGGIIMLGNSAGYTFGGLTEKWFGPLAPFQTAFALLCFCTIFGAFFLPYISPTPPSVPKDGSPVTKSSFLAPLAIFIPRRTTRQDGSKGPRQYSLMLLAFGAFFSVLATGYVPMGLQLVSTNVFAFKPSDSGLMLSLTLLVKAVFLSIAFPWIIKHGRKWYTPSHSQHSSHQDSAEDTLVPPSPTSGKSFGSTNSTTPASRSRSSSCSSANSTPRLVEHPENPTQATERTSTVPTTPIVPAPSATNFTHGSQFDLVFLRQSILLDAILTGLTSLITRPSHVYLAAAILPLASGTGSACKGVVMDFVDAETRADALSAIALVEKLALVSTVGLFGIVFAWLSELGTPTLVFAANGCVALIAFAFLAFVRMPKTHIHPA